MGDFNFLIFVFLWVCMLKCIPNGHVYLYHKENTQVGFILMAEGGVKGRG